MSLVYLKLKKYAGVAILSLLVMVAIVLTGIGENNASLLMNSNLEQYKSSNAGGILFFVGCLGFALGKNKEEA